MEFTSKGIFLSVKNLLEVLDKLHVHVGSLESVQSFDFSTLHTTRPHNLMKQKFTYLSDDHWINQGVITFFKIFVRILLDHVLVTLHFRTLRQN